MSLRRRHLSAPVIPAVLAVAGCANGGESTSGNQSKGKSVSFTFKEPGTYAHHCGFHPTMRGTVVVT